MTVRIRTDIKAGNVTNLPDNTAGEISPADLRNQLADIIDSAVFPEDGGVGGGTTVDTGETFRIIMLSDGTVRAIPVAAVAPVAPTGLAAVVRLTSVNLTWTPVPSAVSYAIIRDGVQVGSNVVPDFRDVTILVGTTYSYQVASIDQYQQRSPSSAAVSATIDASLNQAPAGVTITCWPTPIPTDGPAIVRVNAYEIDVHHIAFTLGVDAGALRATDDPSVWVITI